MGNILGYQGRTDDPDELTGLTSREVYLIKTTWHSLTKNTTELGIELFLNLFKLNPKYHQMFPFRNIPITELPTNKKFHAHCNNVVYSLTAIIEHVDNATMLMELLEHQGRSHKPRGVKAGAYGDLKQAFDEILEPKVSEEAFKAWDKTLTLAMDVMIKAAEY